MENILINITTTVIKENHICYFTTFDCDKRAYVLKEVVDCFYEHPGSEGMALIQQKETRIRETNTISSQSALELLFHAQNNILNIICPIGEVL